MKHILVTGDKGYIGSVLVPMLIDKGYVVTGFDTEYFTNNLFDQKQMRYRSIKKDIRDVSASDVEGVDAVIHLSGLSNDPMGELNPHLTEDINFLATVKLAKLAKKAGVKRFLFSSSCSIYGIGKEETVTENSPTNPLTAYAKSKINAEQALKKLADQSFCVGLLRNSTVYGASPAFRDDLVVNNFVATAVAYNVIKVMSDGTPWRPLIDVRDLSRIFLEFLTVLPQKINGEILNIGFEENNFQVKELLHIVEKAVPSCSVVYTGEHGKDTRSYKVGFGKMKRTFPHIVQQWTVEKSVKDMVRRLKRIKFDIGSLENGKFTRLHTLKDLLIEKKVTNQLYWREQ